MTAQAIEHGIVALNDRAVGSPGNRWSRAQEHIMPPRRGLS